MTKQHHLQNESAEVLVQTLVDPAQSSHTEPVLAQAVVPTVLLQNYHDEPALYL